MGTCRYLDQVLTPEGMRKTVDKMASLLAKKRDEFDAIAFTGLSGCLIAPTVAQRLDCNILPVRKNIEDCHSTCLVEEFNETKRYVIIDDCIAWGTTVKRIVESISATNQNAKFVGIALYRLKSVTPSMKKVADDYGVWVFHQGHKSRPYYPKKA